MSVSALRSSKVSSPLLRAAQLAWREADSLSGLKAGTFKGSSRAPIRSLTLSGVKNGGRVDGSFVGNLRGVATSGKFSALPTNPAVGMAHILLTDRQGKDRGAYEIVKMALDGQNNIVGLKLRELLPGNKFGPTFSVQK